jgi:MATE family multidrug resistance protein
MAPAFMFDGLFLGGTRSLEMRNSVLLGGVAQILTTVALMPWLGIHGLWLSLVAFMVVRGLYLYWRYPAFVASVPLASSTDTNAKA